MLKMEKDVAITILEDIQQALLGENGKENGLKTVEIYRKDLEVATNKKIKKLKDKQKEYCQIYGEDDKRTLKLSKKIDKEIQKIFSK